jgi:hypothetical protein
MGFYQFLLSSQSLAIAAILAMFRFKSISRKFYPVLFMLWIGWLNEVLTLCLAYHQHTTTASNNIYVLIEACLLCWFFSNMQMFKGKWRFYLLLVFLCIAWSVETFFLKTINDNSTYFRILYSFVVVILSVDLASHSIFTTTKPFRNAAFLLCISFIIYFTFKTLLQAFVIYGVTSNTSFLYNLYVIHIYINLGTNLLYALAVLWMPGNIRSLSLSL